jgi:hypothetical protein
MTLTLWPLRWASMARLRPAMPPPATKIDIPVFEACSIVDMGVLQEVLYRCFGIFRSNLFTSGG